MQYDVGNHPLAALVAYDDVALVGRDGLLHVVVGSQPVSLSVENLGQHALSPVSLRLVAPSYDVGEHRSRAVYLRCLVTHGLKLL